MTVDTVCDAVPGYAQRALLSDTPTAAPSYAGDSGVGAYGGGPAATAYFQILPPEAVSAVLFTDISGMVRKCNVLMLPPLLLSFFQQKKKI